jgi:uroporphyrinogen-III decarboxylase
MRRRQDLSSRERVRLALNHQPTDRIPIGLVCAGLNAPAERALDDWLSRERGGSAAQYLAPIVDIVEVSPRSIGPPPFGSREDVRREVEERITVLGRGGEYILGPSHWIQAGTPPQNIAALFDTALSFYPY